MGVYFNPGNESFTQARNSMIYVDKTALLEQLNKRLSTENKCIAVSHARRFGKSHAAGMIDAYYSRGCDSTKLFEDTKIAEDADFKKYLNKYNVIHLDISSFWDDFKDNIVEKIQEYILDELKEVFKEGIDYSKKIQCNSYVDL
ncbi:AAA family ATPase [Blautia sp. HCP3S3_G3]|uniref:AAA family ATPase n=1 Tax=Blautia sp. HCP3S3_G3 TaxID=3438913 RepID=UPI003F8C92A3